MPQPSPPQGISAQTLAARIDAFLASRGYKPPDGSARAPSAPDSPAPPAPQRAERPANASGQPAEFICEDDVRAALRAGRKLVVGEKTIVTPSARDLGESQDVFIHAS